jgi:hypothetical protein
MILPSRAGEDSMIEREMFRVQDQLDTKPPHTCTGKSGTKQRSTPDYSPNTGYDEVSPIVILAKRLCTFALCSSDVFTLHWTDDLPSRPGNGSPPPSKPCFPTLPGKLAV